MSTETAATWPTVIDPLLAGESLEPEVLRWAMDQVMGGTATPAQIAAFLVALRAKGVDGAEIATLVDVMVDHAVAIEIPGITVDTCGTGGDHLGSVNISTMAAIVAAAAGERVVKHGNRAASSLAGSADVLEALGVSIAVPPERIAECVDRVGIAFCFAPAFHPAMKYAGPIRKELGIRSVFNILGPLANPARPKAQVVGVADPAMAPVVAAALATRGTKALVVRGEDGMDELTTAGLTRVWDVRTADIDELMIDAADLGIPRANVDDLAGGDAAENARVAHAALQATCTSELQPVRDAVALNAAAALVVAETARGGASGELGSQLAGGLERARAALDSGAAANTLDSWIAVSNELNATG